MDTSSQQNKYEFFRRLFYTKSLFGWLAAIALNCGVVYGLSILFGISFNIVSTIYLITVFASNFIDSSTDKPRSTDY